MFLHNNEVPWKKNKKEEIQDTFRSLQYYEDREDSSQKLYLFFPIQLVLESKIQINILIINSIEIIMSPYKTISGWKVKLKLI